jgi:ABC transport system ATP-binding/permease protein
MIFVALIDVLQLDFSVGGPLLLEQVNLQIEPRERVCIVGRNGAGKSTLLKLMAGVIAPDDGSVRRNGKVAVLMQEVPVDMAGTIESVIALGLGKLGEAITEFHYLSHHLDNPANMDRFTEVQAILDQENGWAQETRVSQILSRLELDGEREFAGLSGGMKRRVLLGQALVSEPDVLMLDEPTNHLDIEAIQWLEDFLIGANFSTVFVTHDRSFLRRLATRIVEIDRGQVSSWPGDYDNYLRRREERLHAQSQENALFDKKLAAEEVWIRQGIKARRTRNEGRVRALESLRVERSERRNLAGNVRMAAAVGELGGKRVVELIDASFAYGDRMIINSLSTTILRGDRLGIIGPNGAGKTTLLKLLLGDLQPTSGEVNQGSNLQITYFDQLRGALDDKLNAIENAAEGQEFVELNGNRKHVLSYLQDFMFTPERARAPITRLSGGERNRLLLAKLFLKPANVLVLDEPTNDLDVETLDLLEDLLSDYPGTVILVSHDRDFLDKVVTASLVLEGDGKVVEVSGGYSDWLRERPKSGAAKPSTSGPEAVKSTPQNTPQFSVEPSVKKRKPSFKETQELSALPAKLEQLEKRQAEIGVLLSNPSQLKNSAQTPQQLALELANVTRELELCYQRWSELEG